MIGISHADDMSADPDTAHPGPPTPCDFTLEHSGRHRPQFLVIHFTQLPNGQPVHHGQIGIELLTGVRTTSGLRVDDFDELGIFDGEPQKVHVLLTVDIRQLLADLPTLEQQRRTDSTEGGGRQERRCSAVRLTDVGKLSPGLIVGGKPNQL
jgi:hypothetical protein